MQEHGERGNATPCTHAGYRGEALNSMINKVHRDNTKVYLSGQDPMPHNSIFGPHLPSQRTSLPQDHSVQACGQAVNLTQHPKPQPQGHSLYTAICRRGPMQSFGALRPADGAEHHRIEREGYFCLSKLQCTSSLPLALGILKFSQKVPIPSVLPRNNRDPS